MFCELQVLSYPAAHELHSEKCQPLIYSGGYHLVSVQWNTFLLQSLMVRIDTST